MAAVLALLVGIPMACVYAALKRGSLLSQVFMTISLLGVSLPNFLYRHFADLDVCGATGLVSKLYRGDGADRLVENRVVSNAPRLAPYRSRGHAVGHFTGAHHAAGARRDVEVLRTDYIKFAFRASRVDRSHGPLWPRAENTLVPVMTITG